VSKNLLQHRIRPAEFERIVWSVTPEADVTLKELLAPEYWAHVAKALKPGAKVEVLPESKSWFAELLVRSSTDNSVELVVLKHIEFDAPTVADDGEPYEVKHRGGAGWSVIRKSDKAVVFEKGQSKLDAERWVKEKAADLA
jgi:hypothetical protein